MFNTIIKPYLKRLFKNYSLFANVDDTLISDKVCIDSIGALEEGVFGVTIPISITVNEAGVYAIRAILVDSNSQKKVLSLSSENKQIDRESIIPLRISKRVFDLIDQPEKLCLKHLRVGMASDKNSWSSVFSIRDVDYKIIIAC